MRKNSPRKWLHAVLDLLPVILIPVFMIYSHRHDVTENVSVTYKYESNEVNSLDDLVVGNIYYLDEYSNFYDDGLNYLYTINIYHFESADIDYESTAGYFISEPFDSNGYFLSLMVEMQSSDYALYFSLQDYEFNTYIEYDITNVTFYNVIFSIDEGLSHFKLSLESNLPQYTDYNVIESVSVNDTNSDIMSVFMDDFNNAIDKYFNMGNVFNLSGVYQWFNTNIFSGHAPTVIYSVWNIALYELVMDLLFLLYGLFMWFIDMIQKLMEKPLDSVR